ncbi:hypothetical protein [Mucilaginibacter sp. FT3.2]|uniref:hypothetical protein n=1 Tax=Mucilaginibacter sp. FT3.2 TaxID=2723090 RepID=UPI003AFF9B8E
MHQPKLVIYLILVLSLTLINTAVFANTIDDLKADDDVLSLLIRLKAFEGSDPIAVMPTDILLKKLQCSEVAAN